jgi:hypothetical protein
MRKKIRQFALTAAALGSALLLFLAVIDPALFAQGYLAAFVLVSMVPIGSLTLLLVGGLTGGDWMAELKPVLVGAARALPLLPLAFIPIILLRPYIYPWPGDGTPADVARLYLNPAFFAARTLLGLLVLSVLSWRTAWTRQISSAIGLVVVAAILSLLPVDWMLTLRPRSTSAAFGLGFAIEQLLAALGFCALLAPQARSIRANADLAGLILAAILGTVYFGYMQFLITWYGNIPDKVNWYALRTAAPWPMLALGGFVAGAALPFLAMLAPRIRHHAAGMRGVGALVLTGTTLHVAWLVLPALAPLAAGPAIIAAATLALIFAGFEPPLPRWRFAHAP